MEDCIKILDLPDEFDLKTLKKAYRKQVMKYHPDKATNEEERETFEVMMKLINASYELAKEYLETHGGKYTKPKENNSYNNSYNSTKEETKKYDRKRYTDEEILQKAEDFLNKFYAHYEKRTRAKAEEEAKNKEEETSYHQEQSYQDNSYTDDENYEEEESYGNYEEDEEEIPEMSFEDLFTVIKIYFLQFQYAMLFNPKKVIIGLIITAIAIIVISNTGGENEILRQIYIWGGGTFIALNIVNTYKKSLKRNSKGISYYKELKEKVEQEKSHRRLDKFDRKHQAEREQIERERMRKFEEEWERKHPEENTNKKGNTNAQTKDAWSAWKDLRK